MPAGREKKNLRAASAGVAVVPNGNFILPFRSGSIFQAAADHADKKPLISARCPVDGGHILRHFRHRIHSYRKK
ncbi:hypothetical protein D8B20_00160 [Candidatus Pantoea soli]|uniref:Uncharacterized protein n=2 Tax=Candidatus Pantoea soli TaxID=3098669 RepID=A0A518X8A6_9GAMM|nr:hypothetical protein D8B20_00160 [Pantoea soli]